MTLIIGGAYQGKTDYAKSRFGFSDDEILNGESCAFSDVFHAKCVKNYHLLIRRLLDEERDPAAFTEEALRKNPGIVVLLNEIGCGIVPLERSERRWREATGKTGCLLAERADRVVRVSCGIGTTIREAV